MNGYNMQQVAAKSLNGSQKPFEEIYICISILPKEDFIEL